jgi:hypothetical protein
MNEARLAGVPTFSVQCRRGTNSVVIALNDQNTIEIMRVFAVLGRWVARRVTQLSSLVFAMLNTLPHAFQAARKPDKAVIIHRFLRMVA